MKAITKLYLSTEEITKIETMIDDIEEFLIEMEKQGISNSTYYDDLVEAQDNLERFRDEVKGLEDEGE